MSEMSLEKEILEELKKLSTDQQQRVLKYTRRMTQTPPVRGESGKSIIQSAGLFTEDALDEMARAIEEG